MTHGASASESAVTLVVVALAPRSFSVSRPQEPAIRRPFANIPGLLLTGWSWVDARLPDARQQSAPDVVKPTQGCNQGLSRVRPTSIGATLTTVAASH